MNSSDANLLADIEKWAASAPVPGVRLIGIDGPSGAGKSTLSRALSAKISAPIVKIDDFVSWGDFAGWWPRFEAQVLLPLLAGNDAVYQQRDWAGDEFGAGLRKWKRLEWAPVVILEGVTCTRRAATGHLACRVWIDAPADERLRRGLDRDGTSHLALLEQWMRDEADFFARDETRGRADFVVSGTATV